MHYTFRPKKDSMPTCFVFFDFTCVSCSGVFSRFPAVFCALSFVPSGGEKGLLCRGFFGCSGGAPPGGGG
eukprot:COSAG01_NODE_47044_length_394_cov_0.983051_1_plen_70_part_00